MALQLIDQINATQLSNRCIDVVQLDGVWSGFLSGDLSSLSSEEREVLSRLGSHMATEISEIREMLGLVVIVNHAFEEAVAARPAILEHLSDYADRPITMDSIRNALKESLAYIHEHAPQDIQDLRRQAQQLISAQGGTAAGDLPQRLRAALMVVTAVLTLGLSALSQEHPADELRHDVDAVAIVCLTAGVGGLHRTHSPPRDGDKYSNE